MLEEEADEMIADIHFKVRKKKFQRRGILVSITAAVIITVLGIGFYPSSNVFFDTNQERNTIDLASDTFNSDWNMYQNNAINSGFSNYT